MSTSGRSPWPCGFATLCAGHRAEEGTIERAPDGHPAAGEDDRWQLKAVLSVPVLGHSSPLLDDGLLHTH